MEGKFEIVTKLPVPLQNFKKIQDALASFIQVAMP